MATLGELVKFYGGGTPSRSRPEFFTGNIPWVTSKDMKKWDVDSSLESITDEALKESAARLVPAGSVLLVIRSGILKHTLPIGIARRELAINQDLKALVPRNGLNSEYLARYIQAKAPTVLQWVRATTADNFPLDELQSLELRVPSAREQEKVAQQLAVADKLRRSWRYAIQLCDELLPAIFLEIFGDPIKVPSRDLFAFNDILEVQPQNGLYAPSERYAGRDDPRGVEVVHMSDLFQGTVPTGQLKKILLSPQEIAKYGLGSKDLLIARRSINYEGAAQPCMVPELSTPLAFESSIIRVRPDTSRVLPTYLYAYLMNKAVREVRVRPYVTVSTISGINQEGLSRIGVVVPPMQRQKQFDAIVRRHAQHRLSLLEAYRQADHLFRALLQGAFV